MIAVAVTVAVVGAVLVLITGRDGGVPGWSAASTTTPLGCDAPVPSPAATESPALHCTERAILQRICDFDTSDLVRYQVLAVPETGSYYVRYESGGVYHAELVYRLPPADTGVSLSAVCTIPPNSNTRRASVEIGDADWRTITTAGGTLPPVLAPTGTGPTSSPSTTSLGPTPTESPGDDTEVADCEQQATGVFGRLARGEVSIEDARGQLPAKVDSGALDRGLAGIRSYERDGLTREEAIAEVSGAIAQVCNY